MALFSGLIAALVGGLLYAARHHQFGSDAKSPQIATMMMGSRSFVAGGRASLWYAYFDEGPHVDVECGAEKLSMVALEEGEPVEAACGLTLTHLESERVGDGVWRSKIKVEWEK